MPRTAPYCVAGRNSTEITFNFSKHSRKRAWRGPAPLSSIPDAGGDFQCSNPAARESELGRGDADASVGARSPAGRRTLFREAFSGGFPPPPWKTFQLSKKRKNKSQHTKSRNLVPLRPKQTGPWGLSMNPESSGTGHGGWGGRREQSPRAAAGGARPDPRDRLHSVGPRLMPYGTRASRSPSGGSTTGHGMQVRGARGRSRPHAPTKLVSDRIFPAHGPATAHPSVDRR